jgi:hypothetical protein
VLPSDDQRFDRIEKMLTDLHKILRGPPPKTPEVEEWEPETIYDEDGMDPS